MPANTARENGRNWAAIVWGCTGILLVAGAFALTILSQRFVFGEAHADRPIEAFLVIYGLMWIAFAAASALAIRTRLGPLWWIIAAGLLARAALFPSGLIQENDCYRYVLDGEAIVHGVNPYRYAPEEVQEEAPEPLLSAVNSPEGRFILGRISYQDIPTIYPPLAQGVFALGALLTPWDWTGQRAVFLAFDVLTMGMLLWALWLLQKPAAWLVFYAWNPLILKEIANSAHSDSLAGFCLAALLVCMVFWARNRSGISASLAGIALAGAVLARLYPVLLVPLCLAFLLSSHRAMPGEPPSNPEPGAMRLGVKHCMLFLAAFAGAVVVAYVPFLGVGIERLTEGLRTYGAEWQRNSGAFALLASGVGAIVPQEPDNTASVAAFGLSPRTWAALLVAGNALVWAELCWKRGEIAAWIGAMQGTLLGWLLLTPAVYPWYAVGLLAITTLRPRPWAIVLSGALGLYYLLFLYSYRDYPDAWAVWTRTLEHTAIWLAILVPAGWSLLARHKSRVLPG